MNISASYKRWLTLVSLLALVATLGVAAFAQSTAKQFVLSGAQGNSDAALAGVRRQDRAARSAKGVMTRLSPEEHLRRAAIYLANRAFEEAREHWQALISYYPEDARVAQALLGMGRSYFVPRRYAEAYSIYDQLAREYPAT